VGSSWGVDSEFGASWDGWDSWAPSALWAGLGSEEEEESLRERSLGESGLRVRFRERSPELWSELYGRELGSKYLEGRSLL
jgi:hypothetical protein